MGCTLQVDLGLVIASSASGNAICTHALVHRGWWCTHVVDAIGGSGRAFLCCFLSIFTRPQKPPAQPPELQWKEQRRRQGTGEFEKHQDVLPCACAGLHVHTCKQTPGLGKDQLA